MKILAIRFARLGDIILLLPSLASLKRKFPGSELTFLTGHRCAPIAELCPAIDHIISVDRVAMRDGPRIRALQQIGRLVRDVRSRQFDLVVDFHSFRETNLLTWLSGARMRMGMKRYDAPYWGFCFNLAPIPEDKTIHVADMFQRVVAGIPAGAQGTNDGSLIPFPTLGRMPIKKTEQPTVALFVDAPVPERVWPPERFAEVADFAMEKLGASVTVISSSEHADLAVRVRQSSRMPAKLSIFTDLTLPQLAAVIGSAHLFISNDTGPMHIGPAVGVPTIGLFSVGIPTHFRPAGLSDRFVQANPIEQIKAQEVIEIVVEMWTTACRDLRC